MPQDCTCDRTQGWCPRCAALLAMTQEVIEPKPRMGARATEADMRRMLAQALPSVSRETRRVAHAPERAGVYTNKLEERYAGVLAQRTLTGEVVAWWYHPFGIRLADKCYYHPDFFVQLADSTLEIHETKGFMRDDAAVKLKAAARQFPCFVFRLIQWEKKQWVMTEIPP